MEQRYEVFISWSGDVSREIAETLSTFLQHVVRGVDTFVSTEHIHAGDRWEARVTEELASTNHAVLCITRENQSSPWINYEAGALSKLLGRAKVIPYTVGFSPSEMQIGPLSRFQGVENNENGTWSVVRSINREMPSSNEETFIRADFDLWWPRLHDKMYEIAAQTSGGTPEQIPSEREILLEIRDSVQRLVDGRAAEVSNMASIGATATIGSLLEGAREDEVTGLLNRRAFQERAEGIANSEAGAVIGYMDIDHFKQVNDQLGHAKGDEFLRIVALALKENLRDAETIARMGGDEFVAIFHNETTKTVATRLRQFVDLLPKIAARSGFPAITVSVGVSRARPEPLDSKLRDADTAMYRAKEAGRGKVIVADKITSNKCVNADSTNPKIKSAIEGVRGDPPG